MPPPLRNVMFEKVSAHRSVTDSELSKMLSKDGVASPQAAFDKALLDLEIMGLVHVSILSKGTRRIELAEKPDADDDPAEQEHSYEMSFPGET